MDMSKIIFNGATHQVTLVDGNGNNVSSWAAYNNVDSHATLTHIPNGTYIFQDRAHPHRHHAASADTTDGPYGMYGIFRFSVPNHPGIGLHSGRAHARHAPGPQHATMGCIRTSDDAIAAVIKMASTSSLTTIEVIGNAGRAAHAATKRNHYQSLHGRHYG